MKPRCILITKIKHKVKRMNCKLTAIQIISGPNIDDNFEKIIAQLSRLPVLPKELAHLILLPENALCFAHKETYFKIAEVLGRGPLQLRLGELAKQFKCTLICGSFPIQSAQKNKITSTCLVFSAQGELIEHYHKMHLFDANVSDEQAVYRESDTFMAGQEVKVIDCGFAKVGLAICYDLRFPGLFQQLRELGAEIIILPAAFTAVTGEAHWQVLLQARAIETQCYVVAANQGGKHFIENNEYENRDTYGHSMIIDAWGNIVKQLSTGSDFVQVDFERQGLESVRNNMPVQQHNKFNSIQKI